MVDGERGRIGAREIGRLVASSCVVFCAVVIGGCSAKSDRGTLSGNVSLDGQPLKSGMIRFVPADGQTATADAIIADGKFSASMPPGEKRISIAAPKVVGKRKAYDAPDSPTVDIVEELLPARYNVQTELSYTVQAGSQTHDFDLKSSK